MELHVTQSGFFFNLPVYYCRKIALAAFGFPDPVPRRSLVFVVVVDVVAAIVVVDVVARTSTRPTDRTGGKVVE